MISTTLVLALAGVLGYPLPVNAQTTYVASLARCESNFNPTIRIIDTNSLPSTGLFMYQDNTFYTQAKKYNLIPKDMPKSEALKLITNPSLQKKLTELLLEDGHEHHWMNCGLRKLGKYPQ